MLFNSAGVLEYSQHGIRLIVEQEIVEYYRSLVPKSIILNRQRHPAHISVVRNEYEDISNHAVWGRYEGALIPFYYENVIYHGKIFWWLNVFSDELEKIRGELGLSNKELFTQPPIGFLKCFHITIGNSKND